MTSETTGLIRESAVKLPEGEVRIYGPAAPEEICSYEMDDTLDCFRHPAKQKKALKEIASLPKGQVFIACFENVIVGYVTFHPPEPFERWSEGNIPSLLELGAIEVSRRYRGFGLARKLMEVAFMNDAMEDYIVIATEYYWHWDLEGTGLPIWEYRKLLESVMSSVGMEPKETTDPEINSHPANVLMVRIGKNVSRRDIEAFEALCCRREDEEFSYFDNV
ncbi:MAG TPA: N-acetyltransferase [Peptococcaceae bacterium]|nr:MAG: Acetoin utilization protein [Clostridia bacterium 41_269]HBT20348.1 N-acetyltransferase [Peptococcaceae bacterium]